MNSKLIAVGVSAFSYGALVAWAFTADHLEAKMKRNQLILSEMLSRKEARIADLEERFLDRTPWQPVQSEDVQAAASLVTSDILGGELQVASEIDEVKGSLVATVESIVEPGDEAAMVPAAVDEPVDEVTLEHTRRNLQSLIDEYTADPNTRDEFVEQAGRVLDFAHETPPFHISRELYASDPEEGDGYAKITITYYSRGRVLLDDDEEVIDDVENYVGWRNLNRFGDESGDPDTVFVRNRRLLTDFEVVREEDEDPPPHVRYAMSREEYRTKRAAGIIKFRDEDRD